MDVKVITPTPAFLNDILDEVRVFFGRDVHPGSDNACTLIHEENAADNIRHVSVTLTLPDGATLCESAEAPVGEGALEDKRVHKRLIKTCVYRLFKKQTGTTPMEYRKNKA